MPRCPNGHEQELGLSCKVCGARLSYRQACRELLNLPRVRPDFGKVATFYVGLPPTQTDVSYTGVVRVGDLRKQTKGEFTVEKIQGGTWLDFYSKNSEALSRWLRFVGFDRPRYRFVVVDTRDPLSVLALASLPHTKQSIVIVITADQGSTPVEQNTSYVAMSTAQKRGFSVLVFPQAFVEGLFSLAEDKTYVTKTEALLRIVTTLIGHADDVIDLMERDLQLGVRVHYVSALISGSKLVYGTATNAFAAQSYLLSQEVEPDDVKTVYSLVLCGNDLREEFERGYAQFRSRRFKDVLSAECKFHDKTGSALFDLLTIYGVSEPLHLRASLEGYNNVAKRVNELKVERVA